MDEPVQNGVRIPFTIIMISPLLIIWLPPSSIRHPERIADFKAWVNFCPTQLYSGGYILAGEYIGVRVVSRVSLGRIKGVIYFFLLLCGVITLVQTI